MKRTACMASIVVTLLAAIGSFGSCDGLAAEVVSDPSGVNQAGWATYHNPVTGLSFRYPPSLWTEGRLPKSFGLPEAQEITDLLGQTKAGEQNVVLRFIVNRGTTNPEMAARRISLMKANYSGSNSYQPSAAPIQVDGHEALVAVDCGRAACHWSVNIFQPRACTINSPLAAYGEPPLRDDDLFPLRTIIDTVHFDTAS